MGSEGPATLREAALDLARLSDAEVLAGLAAAVERWRTPGGPLAAAIAGLAGLRGESEAMLRFGLERFLRTHDRRGLEGWLADARAEATREALLARSAVLLKPASEEPVLAPLFRETLLEVSPPLGNAVAIESWKGGDEGVEARVLGAADFVVATGGEEMAASLGRRLAVPHRIYGPRFAVAVIGMDWLHAPASWWEEAAREIVLWDQKGCLSPRVVFAAGNPARFAKRLAEAMMLWEERWPAPPRPAGEAAAVHGFRAPYALADGQSSGYLGPEGTAWTVAWDAHPTLDYGPPARTVRVTRRPPPREMAALLAEAGESLQGVALEKLGSRDPAWRRAFSRLDVPRVAPLTRIQDPPAGWRADGRSSLAELLLRGHLAGRTVDLAVHGK
jgi:hypothetical protein